MKSGGTFEAELEELEREGAGQPSSDGWRCYNGTFGSCRVLVM